MRSTALQVNSQLTNNWPISIWKLTILVPKLSHDDGYILIRSSIDVDKILIDDFGPVIYTAESVN